MYEVFVQTQFSAAHRLAGYEGDCARFHGHNWQVTVFIRCRSLNAVGIAVDFRDIKHYLSDLLLGLDHTDLNQHPEFQGRNPTSEAIACFLYHKLVAAVNTDDVRVHRVQVSESPNTGATYFEEDEVW